MGTLKTYDPARVFLYVGGVKIEGFMKGTFIKVSRDEETWKGVTDADGKNITRTKNNNRIGKISFTLSQSSPSNRVLSGLEIAGDLGTTYSVGVIDSNSSSIYGNFANCYFTKPADAEFADESTGREWTMEVPDLEMFTSGILVADNLI